MLAGLLLPLTPRFIKHVKIFQDMAWHMQQKNFKYYKTILLYCSLKHYIL